MIGDDYTDELQSAINVTPLVDVMLVLLVIFMVVTPLLRQQLPIDLPSTRTSQAMDDAGQVRLTALADGTILLNGQPTSKDLLRSALRTLYETRSERTLFVEADGGLPYASVVEMMDACRDAGVDRIGVVTRKAPAPPGGEGTGALPTHRAP